MNYLTKSLSGEALMTVKGLKLSNSNYHVALDLLIERFDDPQLLISAHVGNSLNLPNVCSINNLQELRFLYDRVETEVQSLDCLGLPTTNYGPMLVPVLMEKIPSELKLMISRKCSNKEIWNIKNILVVYKEELEAREKVFTKISGENSDSKQPYSALNLFDSGKHNSHSKQEKPHEKSSKKKFSHDKQEQLSNDEYEFVKSMCIFCRRNHKTNFCDIIAKPEIRKEILFKEKHCFICMKKGHSAKQCRNTMKFFKCSGRHHVAVCTFQNRDSGNLLQPQEDHSTTSD